MNNKRSVICLVLVLVFLANLPSALADDSGSADTATGDNPATSGIVPGTRITMQNWQQFRQFMPDGMVALFQGSSWWKMAPDVAIEVGPTVICLKVTWRQRQNTPRRRSWLRCRMVA
jgi:hypothetical protein